MSWTITKEDEMGNTIFKMPQELKIPDLELLPIDQFKMLKYLDPFGDTVFNKLMIDDLIYDLNKLKKISKINQDQIDRIIDLGTEVKNEVHTYLKFYGD